MKMYGNGKFWKLTYIHRGGVKCANQNSPQYIICGRKIWKKIWKKFFRFWKFWNENLKWKKEKENIKWLN